MMVSISFAQGFLLSNSHRCVWSRGPVPTSCTHFGYAIDGMILPGMQWWKHWTNLRLSGFHNKPPLLPPMSGKKTCSFLGLQWFTPLSESHFLTWEDPSGVNGWPSFSPVCFAAAFCESPRPGTAFRFSSEKPPTFRRQISPWPPNRRRAGLRSWGWANSEGVTRDGHCSMAWAQAPRPKKVYSLRT